MVRQAEREDILDQSWDELNLVQPVLLLALARPRDCPPRPHEHACAHTADIARESPERTAADKA